MTDSLFDLRIAGEIIFFIFVGVSIAGAVIAVFSKRMTRAVLGLALYALGIAVFYLYLGSAFISVMQLLIYVRAICVVIAFAVMLADPSKQSDKRGVIKGLLVLIPGILPGLGLGYLVIKTDWIIVPVGRFPPLSAADIGRKLLVEYCLVFEVISLIFLVAVIGSVIVARMGRNE